MPIEMPKGLPFSVDTWSPSSKTKKRHHFLTHAHRDHSSGIASHFSFPIYSTALTISLLLQQFPQVILRPSSFLVPIFPFMVRLLLICSVYICAYTYSAWWVLVRENWGWRVGDRWRPRWILQGYGSRRESLPWYLVLSIWIFSLKNRISVCLKQWIFVCINIFFSFPI